MLYFCNRGRENLRETMISDFEIKTDGAGKKFVTLIFNRQTKNHRGDDLTDDDIKGGTMYEIQGDRLCPIRSFEKYVSLLNSNCEFFWQRPKPAEKVTNESTVWYDNVAVGRNTLGDNMKSFSIDCNLSKVYTNHCIRATCISILDEAGINDRHICGISGHKSTESLKIYKSKLSEGKKRAVSSVLCQKLVPNEAPVLPSGFTVEPLSESEINADSAIQDFLSPSQEDTDLAAITDEEMVHEENVPNNHNGKRSSKGDANGENLGKRVKVNEQSNPSMHLVNHGTVHIHYHYH